ncbi:hypothetical protein N9515_09090 [Vicingaceae bacterium]|nr:hypothetical protein [Vicingaceae bacterium]MDB4062075.1 hypothetical protein [Vicingaceae bacterium]
MKKHLLTLSFIFSLLVSCGPKINPGQQESLQNLTNQVDSVTELVNALDSAELNQLADNFFDRKNFIQNQIVDTLKPEMIFKLDAFVQLRKEMGFIRGEYGTIKNEANILKKQLIDLNHDVSEGLVDKKQFDRYFSLEKTNYDQLTMATNQLSAAITKGSKKYNDFLPEIDSLITAYKESLNE